MSEVHDENVRRQKINELLKFIASRADTLFNLGDLSLREGEHLFKHFNIDMLMIEVFKELNVNIKLNVREDLFAGKNYCLHFRIHLHFVHALVAHTSHTHAEE